MEFFKKHQVVGLKPWEEIVLINKNPQNVHCPKNMWEELYGNQLIVDKVTTDGYLEVLLLCLQK
jgi:hypothetical protein